MANTFHVLFFSLVGGLFSLAGGYILLSNKKSALALSRLATPFAAGALLAATFFDLLPEALGELSTERAMQWTLAGIVIFFLLEHFFHWFHHHHEHESERKTPAPLIVVGDTLHNFIDGVAIGAAFLIDVPTGVVASMAIAVHEIPQEIGDFGLLLKFGYKKSQIIKINIVSALGASVGALATFWLGTNTELPTAALLALTAGMFIYVAASDLIPTIHQETRNKSSHTAVLLLLLGILTIAVTTTLAHQYIDSSHDHSHEDETSHILHEDEHSDEHNDEHDDEPSDHDAHSDN